MDRHALDVLHRVDGQVRHGGMEGVEALNVFPHVFGHLINQLFAQIRTAAQIGAGCEGGQFFGLILISIGRDHSGIIGRIGVIAGITHGVDGILLQGDQIRLVGVGQLHESGEGKLGQSDGAVSVAVFHGLGAGGGIGLAISEGLLRAGAEVALCNRTTAKCKPLADRINAEGGTASVHQLDVTSLDSIHACVDEVMAKYGKIDVLFNVAGINKREGLLDVEEADYDRIMDTNLKGLFFMGQAVAREMYKRRTGSIINIGSHNDEGMLGGCSVYGATKSGVVALTRAMAIEFAQYGIRANAISPGHILTDLTQVTWDHPTRAPWLRERIAMKRPGSPEELVGMAILLASDASSYMTGQAYHIDGGCLCGGAPWDYDTQYNP